MWNYHILGLQSPREADALLLGDAFHTGLADFYAGGKAPAEKAESHLRERYSHQNLLEEEKTLVEHNARFTRVSVEKYLLQWKGEPIQILMPEVSFRIPLPNTEHHCYFAHRLAYPDIPYDQCKGSVDAMHKMGTWTRDKLLCWQPHFFTGRTDAVISWRNMIWLLETKTTSITGDLFFDKFHLDTQTTGYLYGVWKATGVRPHGFLLNVLKKPNKRASDPFAVQFEREAYIRDDESLQEIEDHLIQVATSYERAVVEKEIFQNTRSCINYNRRCYYFDLCKRHHKVEEGEFKERTSDYVDLAYYELLNLPLPPEEGK